MNQLVVLGICGKIHGPVAATISLAMKSSIVQLPNSHSLDSHNFQNIEGRFTYHILDTRKGEIIIPDLSIFIATCGTELWKDQIL